MREASWHWRWLEGDRFWYLWETEGGRKFFLVDPHKKTKALFDHARIAAGLIRLTGLPYDSSHLPFDSVRFVKEGTAFEIEVAMPSGTVLPEKSAPARSPTLALTQGSDRRKLVFEY